MVTRRAFVGGIAIGVTGAVLATRNPATSRDTVGWNFSEAALAQRSAVQSAAPGIVWLNANEYPDGPPAVSIAAMSTALNESNRYHYEEFDSFYKALSEHLHLDPGNILVGAGSSEVLHCAVEAFVGPGRPFITCWPSFEAGPELAASKGAQVIKLPLQANQSADVERLATEAKRAGGGLIYVCNPNNPTSSLTPASDIRWLAENLPAATYLLVDEAYIHFTDVPEEDRAISLVRNGKNVIVSRTFSKIYGMAGLRVGFAIAQPELITRMSPYRNNVISIIGVRAVLAALQLGPKLIEERRARIIETRSGLVKWCREKKISFIEPHANFMMIETGRDVREVSEGLSAKRIAPGRPFPPYNKMLRITIGADTDMERFKKALAEVLDL